MAIQRDCLQLTLYLFVSNNNNYTLRCNFESYGESSLTFLDAAENGS